jgi:putative addiction module killer protein
MLYEWPIHPDALILEALGPISERYPGGVWGCEWDGNNVAPRLIFCNRSITMVPMTYTVKVLDEFSNWLKALKDGTTRLRLSKRLRKAQLGNLGDVATVGEGVFEMREHFGPGWRMYYVLRGETLIVMLGGGDKSTQQADIRRAIALANSLED